MYEILLDGKSLYYPGDTINAVTEAKITEALNDSGYMDITVPPTNPLYEYIYERKSVIEVKKNSSVIWEGEVIDIFETMKKEKKLYTSGVMSYLNDSLQEKKEYLNKTAVQILGELINEHNAQVEERKHFSVGVVTIDVPEGTMNLTTNYESTLSVIREKICAEYNGYIRIRWVDGVRYLDVVKIEDYGNTCLQSIQFGRNLLDYAKNLSAGSVVTCVVPLGAEVEDGTFLNIKSVNNGLSYIFNQEAVNSFGWIRKAVKFKDITDAQALLETGEKWLTENQYANLTFEVNAVDLSLLKANMDSFNLGDYVNAKAKPFGLDAWYYIRKKVTDLLHPDKNTITIGDTVLKSYTQQIKQEIGNIEKEIPSATKILLAAKQNASNLIKSATTGFIVLNPDENGNSKELLVMDTPDIETAKKLWRLNINGFGYSSNGYDGEYGTAITMDGAIVADFITAGTMYADRIKGGTLTLGGTDNNNGVLIVLDKDSNIVGRLNKDGLWAKNGYFEGDIVSKNAEITGGYINIETSSEDYSYINLYYGSKSIKISPYMVNTGGETGVKVANDFISLGSTSSIYSWVEKGEFRAVSGSSSSTLSHTGIKLVNTDFYSQGGEIDVYGTNLEIHSGSLGIYGIDTSRNVRFTGTNYIYGTTHIGSTSYDSLTVAAASKFTGNVSFSGSVSFSKDIDFGSNVSVTGTFQTKGTTKLCDGTYDTLGFFGGSGSTKKSVSTIYSTSSATASTNATKINEIINALKAYNLM